MNANSILQSDVLDILFENRNKKYGAYALRKEYNKRLMTAIGAMFSLVAIVVVCLSFKTKDKTPQMYIADDVILDAAPATPPPPKKETIAPLIKPKLDAGAPKPPVATIANTTPIITAEDIKTSIPTVDDMEGKMISDKTSDGKADVGIVQPQGNGNGTSGNGNDNVTTAPAPDENAILKTAEFMPEYPGGASAMTRFLLKNLRPMTDDEERVIKVLVRFIVDKTGAVTGFEVVGSGGQEYDKEVLRVLKKMPNWKPASQNGHPVNVYMTLPVVFQTQSE